MHKLMPNPEKEATYEMLGGGTISGSNPQELAEALRNSSYTPLGSLEEFVEDVAQRCRDYDHDARVRTSPLSAFIEDLIAHGFLVAPEATPPNVVNFPPNPDEETDR